LAKRRLDFQYVLFWTVLSVLIIVVALNVGWLERIAAALNVFYAPSVLFAAALVFLLVFVFYITMFISNITKRVIRLTQEVGLLKSKIDALEKKEEDA
jgi:hypothetical protein